MERGLACRTVSMRLESMRDHQHAHTFGQLFTTLVGNGIVAAISDDLVNEQGTTERASQRLTPQKKGDIPMYHRNGGRKKN